MNDYYSLENQRRYMSVSQYKKFSSCSAAAMAELNGEWERPETPALIHGRYVDAYVEGRLDDFIADHPEMISSRGATAGQLKAEFKSLHALIERFERDNLFMAYLEGKKQVVLTGDIDGITWRGKLDVLHDDRIVDFKTVRDFETLWSAEEQDRLSPVEYWGWDIQGAVYQELERQRSGKRKPFYIAAVTKQDVPDIAILHVPDDVLSLKLQEVQYFQRNYHDIKTGKTKPIRCEKCVYCRETKELTGPVDYREVDY